MTEGENVRLGRNQPDSILSLALRVQRGELTMAEAIDLLRRAENGQA